MQMVMTHDHSHWAKHTYYIHASSSVSGTVKSADHQIILTRLNCAIGLAELATRKYKVAARHFLSASLDHCDIPDMMSTQVGESAESDWT